MNILSEGEASLRDILRSAQRRVSNIIHPPLTSVQVSWRLARDPENLYLTLENNPRINEEFVASLRDRYERKGYDTDLAALIASEYVLVEREKRRQKR
jgi:hypothetical protein